MDLCGLQDVTLVGFSMGGGEVARYITRHGESRLHSQLVKIGGAPHGLNLSHAPAFTDALLSFLRP